MNRYVLPAALVAAGALALPGAATAAPKLKTSPSRPARPTQGIRFELNPNMRDQC